MRLETYISDLLYRYQCVVVPGFGAFLTRYQPAGPAADAAMFHPPAKRISFNVQLTSNDGLLAKYIADVKKISYEEALRYISKKVEGWKSAFQQKETVALKNIGELWKNENGNLQFQPLENVNYLVSSFGLAPVMHHEIHRETLKKEVEMLEERSPLQFTPENPNRRYLRYAAVFLLLIAAGTTTYHMLKNRQLQQYETVRQEAQQEVEKTIQQATFFNTEPAMLPSITLTLDKTEKEEMKEAPKYHVVGGAFRIEANADTKVRELIDKGYNARKAGINRYGLHIVSYGSFSGAGEALSLLRNIRETELPEAWLWVSQ